MICLIMPKTRKIQSNYTKVESRTCMLNTKTKILPYQTDNVSITLISNSSIVVSIISHIVFVTYVSLSIHKSGNYPT